ncbi:hypothetical protein [Streptomyces sp. NRRL S-1448]|uniref:hypothetical protein n=1 Tax=Streptomyces sp. NRRL S-1448 TaxID=1463883 RepID=UPI0004C06DC4|nr:hypothetical protein [Streptomyces sp. NRRL S-1448]
MPEHVDHHEDRQEIRLRVTGTDNPQQDLDDLRAWLEHEPWLGRREHTWEHRPQPPHPAGDGDGSGPADMAVGVDDLVLVIVGAIATEVTKGLSIALREWLRRRKEERAAGEEPAVEIVGDGGSRPAVGPVPPDPGGPAHESGSTGED